MSTFAERLKLAADTFIGTNSRAQGPPGGVSFGTSWLGGPLTTDAWGAKRAPSPFELIELFKSISYSCANRNADAVSAVPLRLYANSSRDGKKPSDRCNPQPVTRSQLHYLRKHGYVQSSTVKVDDIHEIRDYPFLNTLNHPDPNGDFNLTKLIQYSVLCMDILGRAYFYPEGPKGMPYRWFWPLFSQYVQPIRETNTPLVKRYQYFNEVLDRRDVFCLTHKMSLRDPYGASFPPLYAAVEYAKLEDKFVSIQEQLMAMGPRPNIIASPKDPNMPVGEPERLKFEQDLNVKHARSAQGRVIVTTGAWDLSPISYSPTDLAGLKIAEYDLERICGAFDVPIEFFTKETNLANQQAAEGKHAKHGVRPRCVTIANGFTLIVQQWDPRLFFAFDNAFPEDEERTAKIHDMKVKNGSMTWNQANADSGLPPHPDGDEPWIPTTYAPLSKIKELHDAAIKASEATAKGKAEGGGNAALKSSDKKKGKKSGSGKGSSGSSKSSRSGLPGGNPDSGDAKIHGNQLREGEDSSPFSWDHWVRNSVGNPTESQ